MEILNGFPVIDDTFRVDPNLDGEHGRGYIDRDYLAYPLGGQGFSRAFSQHRYTLDEIIERIKEKTANKSWMTDKCDRVGSKVKNQSRSNYCWKHAPIRGAEIKYVIMGGEVKTLSAFWGAARIKNGRNQGGWGIQAAEYMAKYGAPLESLHPPMDFSVDRNPETEANAARHQLVTWDDIEPSDKLTIWSSVVDDHAVTVGIPAWGHEVCLTFLVLEGNTIREGFDNSWGTSWGNNGRGVLKGNMQRFSEAGRIGVMEPAAD